MIPKSALEALNKLVEKWHAAAKNGMPTYGHALGTDLCADELSATLQSIEPTEARVTIAWLQDNLPWTIPYSTEFEASATVNPDRRISHDVLHVMKSLGRIAAACESADHAREPKPIEWPKEVADLVICALHIARLKGFSLEDAVIDCSSLRNDVDLRASIASPVTKAETQPVAWRAWSKPVPGRKWPSDQWVYWDEEPTTIQDDPEFSQFQALYAHPAPEAATIDAEALAKEIANAIPWGDGTPDERLARRDGYARIIAPYLRKHASEHAGKQGWVRVPREPTRQMLKDGSTYLYPYRIISEREAGEIYGAMIAAASPPLAQEGEKQ